ncbi:MAG: mandelate racemase/muconate lactonizing enzyme family protein, partial [Verrucomicrobiota bacterium]
MTTPSDPAGSDLENTLRRLDQAAAEPVLRRELFPAPVTIESLDLLRDRDSFLCRARSTDGAEGICVSNDKQIASLYPIFNRRLRPFFLGKDARDLEALLDGVYVHGSNYKLQGLALWLPLATIEFALLDLLGRTAGRPLTEVIGEIRHPSVSIYQANNNRGRSAEETLERIQAGLAKTQAKAIKIKVGGRMGLPEEPPGRSEALIPLVRETLGSEMVLYADANGSYDVAEGLGIGRLLEEARFSFFEEPVPFDHYEETRQVARGLGLPIAGGEQEASLRNFRWLLSRGALQIAQPDLFYCGGMIRSTRIARMAATVGATCVPHLSGTGLGLLYNLLFVATLPNAGPYHEFKDFDQSIPLEC